MPGASPLRVGLVGAGRWGRNYLHTLATLPGCRLVGVADPSPDPGLTVAVFTGFEELLDRARPEAVVIAAPDPTHYPLARACLEAGCDVLVEKPMALSATEAEALGTLGRALGRVIAVGQTTLYHPGCRRLRSGIEQGLIGQPVAADSVRTSRGIPGSDLLWDLAPHSVALAVALFGPPGQVSAERDDRQARFRLECGETRFDARLAWHAGPPERRLTVRGTAGELELDELQLADPPPLTALCRDFIHCCRTRQQPLADDRLGARVVAVIEALQESARAGGTPVALEEACACP